MSGHTLKLLKYSVCTEREANNKNTKLKNKTTKSKNFKKLKTFNFPVIKSDDGAVGCKRNGIGQTDSQHGLSNLHLGCREGVIKRRKKLESPRLI